MTGNIIIFTGLLQPTDVLVAVDAAKSCVAFLYIIIILLLAFANKSTQFKSLKLHSCNIMLT